MEFLINNWVVIASLTVLAIYALCVFIKHSKKTKEEQIAMLKEWLKIMVMEAEKQLGEGTGEAKLRLVFNWAVTAFPWLIHLVTFEDFKKLVDEALNWAEQLATENEFIKEYMEQ